MVSDDAKRRGDRRAAQAPAESVRSIAGTAGKGTLVDGSGTPLASTGRDRPPYDVAADSIGAQLNLARQLMLRLSVARASKDPDKAKAVAEELRRCLHTAGESIKRAEPSEAIVALRDQLEAAEFQAAVSIGDPRGVAAAAVHTNAADGVLTGGAARSAVSAPAETNAAALESIGGSGLTSLRPPEGEGHVGPRVGQADVTATPILDPSSTSSRAQGENIEAVLQAFPSAIDVKSSVGAATDSEVFLTSASVGRVRVEWTEARGQIARDIAAVHFTGVDGAEQVNAGTAPGKDEGNVPLRFRVSIRPTTAGTRGGVLVLRSPQLSGALQIPINMDIARAGTPAKTNQQQENPSYNSAKLFVEKFFRREGEFAELCGKAAQAGFDAFKMYSSNEYNKSSNVALDLFTLALSLLPAGNAISGLAKELFHGDKTKRLVSVIEKLRDRVSDLEKGSRTDQVIEAVVGTKEAINKGQDASEHAKSEHETKEGGDFQVQVVRNMLELTANGLEARWSNEDNIDRLLGAVRYADKNLKLDSLAQSILGDLPSGDMAGAMLHAADAYEYNLYLQYYATEGRASGVLDRNGERGDEYDDLPDGVKRRIALLESELQRKGEFRSSVKIWRPGNHHAFGLRH